MKKWICMFLIAAMLLSCAACGIKPGAESGVDAIDLQTILYLMDDLSGLEMAKFCQQVEITAENAGQVVGSQEFQEPFASARALMPMINASPFVLAVFRLEAQQDADAFAKALEEQANPAMWICVCAEAVETVVSGQTVLFFMSGKDMAEPLRSSFSKICEPGFRPEEHLVDKLKGLTMNGLYQELYKEFSVEMYGFMDGKELKAVTADTGFGLGKLDSGKFTDSLVDTGYFPAEEYDGERSYLFAMFRLAEGVDAEGFAKELVQQADISSLQGEGSLISYAWSKDVVILFGGAGSLQYTGDWLTMTLCGTYRMNKGV